MTHHSGMARKSPSRVSRMVEYLCRAYADAAATHNRLRFPAPLDATPRFFHDRPFRVLDAGRFALALLARVTDPAVAALPPVGAIDQFADTPFCSATWPAAAPRCPPCSRHPWPIDTTGAGSGNFCETAFGTAEHSLHPHSSPKGGEVHGCPGAVGTVMAEVTFPRKLVAEFVGTFALVL